MFGTKVKMPLWDRQLYPKLECLGSNPSSTSRSSWEAAVTQVLESSPPIWENWMEMLAPDLSLAMRSELVDRKFSLSVSKKGNEANKILKIYDQCHYMYCVFKN